MVLFHHDRKCTVGFEFRGRVYTEKSFQSELFGSAASHSPAVFNGRRFGRGRRRSNRLLQLSTTRAPTPGRRSIRQFHWLAQPSQAGESSSSVPKGAVLFFSHSAALMDFVTTTPGLTAFTRTPFAASSSAAQRVNWSRPALDTQ